MPGSAWEKIGLRKRAERAAKIPNAWRLPSSSIPQSNGSVLDVPRTCGILTAKELEITENYDATALAEAIREKRLKCIDVATAFCKRAAIAQQLTNCLTEILFSEALARAKTLDAHLEAGKPPLGPLHGVPVSLKDTFKIIGVDASIGLAALCYEASSESSALVTILLKAGAVLYCKTNVPQTLGALDSHNNVFGRTLNPRNAAVTAGGSSGGEGALIALRGSVLGVGTDVGGSIRVPAMVNGLYGIKPSWQRIPYAGQENGTVAGQSKVAMSASAGPLATSLRDCELFFRTVTDLEPWNIDQDVIPGVWDSLIPLKTKRLNVGLITTDGLMKPLPPIKNLLREVSSALSSAGVNIIEVDVRHVLSKCQRLANAFLGIAGTNKMFDLLESTKEPLSPWLRTRSKRRDPVTMDQAIQLHGLREQLERDFSKVWNVDHPSQAIDVLLCPVAPHPTPEIDRWNATSYTIAFNLLDCPASVIPVRLFEPGDTEGEVPNSKSSTSWDKANRALWTDVDRSVYVGTPLCIQLVTPKLQERRLYDAMAIIDGVIRSKHGVFDKVKSTSKL